MHVLLLIKHNPTLIIIMDVGALHEFYHIPKAYIIFCFLCDNLGEEDVNLKNTNLESRNSEKKSVNIDRPMENSLKFLLLQRLGLSTVKATSVRSLLYADHRVGKGSRATSVRSQPHAYHRVGKGSRATSVRSQPHAYHRVGKGSRAISVRS